MTVSVVVLSYNRPHLLREALAAIAAQTRRPNEVIVVDNRSPRSAEVAAVVGRFPGVRLIANATNLGFTGGMNVGLRAATGEHVLLTEDDIIPEPSALGELLRHSERDPTVLAGGLMLNTATRTVRCAGGRVRLGPRFELEVIGENAPDDGRFAEPFVVTFLPGAFLFAPRVVWQRLGGFRERFFLYMEDVDLALRAAAARVPLHVVPAARVRHFDPPLRPDPGWLRRLKIRNLLRLYCLHAPAGVLTAALGRYGVWLGVRDLARLRASGWHAAAALAATLLELPALLRERRRPPTL